MNLAAKRTLLGATSNENQITHTYCRWKIIQLYEKEQVTLYFYRRRFSIFLFFSAVFSTLNLSFCGLSRNTGSYSGDFK